MHTGKKAGNYQQQPGPICLLVTAWISSDKSTSAPIETMIPLQRFIRTTRRLMEMAKFIATMEQK